MEGPHRVVGALSRVWGGLSCGETILTSGLVPGHEKGPTVGGGAFYVRFRRLGEDAASVVGVAVAVRTVLFLLVVGLELTVIAADLELLDLLWFPLLRYRYCLLYRRWC